MRDAGEEGGGGGGDKISKSEKDQVGHSYPSCDHMVVFLANVTVPKRRIKDDSTKWQL